VAAILGVECLHAAVLPSVRRRDSSPSTFIAVVPNGRSTPAILLRVSDREGRRVRKRTLANLTGLAPTLIDELRVLLAGGTVFGRPEEELEIRPAAPHGHVSAVLATMRRLDVLRLLGRSASRDCDLALALIASR
jgi:hypothetical protein